MSKRIVSPVARFPGAVTLHDPLTFPQYIAWEAAVREVTAGAEQNGNSDVLLEASLQARFLPGICACVEQWEIQVNADAPRPLTPDTFPATPRLASVQLIAWLVGEISALLAEAEVVPKVL